MAQRIRRPEPDRRKYVLARCTLGESGCWLWTGCVSEYGYGRVHPAYGGKQVSAHRLSYESLVGPIPEGMTLDHLCAVPLCVNPEHLEPVTLAENSRRAMARRRVARNAKLRAIADAAGLEWSPRTA